MKKQKKSTLFLICFATLLLIVLSCISLIACNSTNKNSSKNDGTLDTGTSQGDNTPQIDFDALSQFEYALRGDDIIITGLKNKDSTDIVVPDGVIYIDQYAFMGCENLVSVNLPNSVTHIGEYAFNNCKNLQSINIPEGIKQIASYSFAWCNSLENVKIPNSVLSIEAYAFAGTNIKDDSLGKNITTIGHYAFASCKNLVNLSIPQSVIRIGAYAFTECSGLTSITIPYGVTLIDEAAFSKCTELTSLFIPASVTKIAARAFSGCNSLTGISVENGNPTYHSKDNCLIETATKTLALGCSSSVIPSDGSVTSIGNCAFEGCIELTNITIPEGVTSIGNSTFLDCTLTSIIIPNSVTSIGQIATSLLGIGEIIFHGTKDEWAAILKANIPFSDYTIVHCTNGDTTYYNY